MPLREKDRKRRRRQRRKRKIHKLKSKLADTKDLSTRRKIIEKIRRLSPWIDLPDAV